MSEEEIIKYIKDEIENEIDTFHWFDNTPKNETRRQIEKSIKAHQGLLDLYTYKKGRVEELKQELLEEKEKNKNSISKDKIRKDLETCQKVYEEEMKPYQTEYGLNVTDLNKKEKEQLVNKRNCLITQMKTYEMLLEE